MNAHHLERPTGVTDPRTELTPADLVIEIRSEGCSDSARRTAALEALKEALDLTYQALGSGSSGSSETVALLDEVSRSRITAWLRVHAVEESSAACDHPLLKFLSRGTLVLLGWMQEKGDPQLAHLQQALQVLAAAMFGDGRAEPAPPSAAALVDSVLAWQAAKKRLAEGDLARVIAQHGFAELNSDGGIADPRLLLLGKKVINPATDMIFVVEMPDYQQRGEWQLKHGNTRVSTTCKSGTLLDRFYRRELDIRPGDALHCKVEFETSYGPDYEVLDESFRIVEVLEVLPSLARRGLACGERHSVRTPHTTPSEQISEGLGLDDDAMIHEVEGDFGVLTLRRLPIH